MAATAREQIRQDGMRRSSDWTHCKDQVCDVSSPCVRTDGCCWRPQRPLSTYLGAEPQSSLFQPICYYRLRSSLFHSPFRTPLIYVRRGDVKSIGRSSKRAAQKVDNVTFGVNYNTLKILRRIVRTSIADHAPLNLIRSGSSDFGRPNEIYWVTLWNWLSIRVK